MLRKSLRKLLNRRLDAEAKREALMEAINKATQSGCCVILGESAVGTRVIVLGKSTYQSQLDEIAKSNSVTL